jgi:hypothetical protein
VRGDGRKIGGKGKSWDDGARAEKKDNFVRKFPGFVR